MWKDLKARDLLIRGIIALILSAVSLAVSIKLGWMQVSGPGEFALWLAAGLAAYAVFLAVVRQGDRLWRWLGLDAP